jgi:hypothetical protein
VSERNGGYQVDARTAWDEGYEAAMDDFGAHDSAPLRRNPYLAGHERNTAGNCRTCGTPYPCPVRNASYPVPGDGNDPPTSPV